MTARLAAAERRPRLAAVAVALLCGLAFAPGLVSLPPIDRTEVRYAQGAKQMLERGEFTAPRFQDEPRFTKPIGVYWLQALSAWLAGEANRSEIWAYRLPSAICALLGVLISFFAIRHLFGTAPAVIAGALLSLNLILVLQAHLALTKAILFVFIAAAQWALARIYVSSETPHGAAAVFWIAQGGGILTGVLALPLLSLTTILGLVLADRSIAWLRRLQAHWGLPLALVTASPWLIAITLSAEADLLRAAWAEASLGDFAGPQEMNWRALPGIFVIGIWLGALLGALFLPPAVRWLWAERQAAGPRFLLVWIVAYLLAIELFSAKPPLYTLQSLLPAVACAAAVPLWSEKGRRIGWPNLFISALLGLLSVAVLAVIITLMAPPVRPLPVLAWLCLAGCTGLALLAARRGLGQAALGLFCAAMIAFYAAFFAWTLPRFDRVWTSARLAEAARFVGPCLKGPIAVAGYTEPSAVFLLGTDTRLFRGPGSGVDAARWLKAGQGRLAFVTEDRDETFRQALGTARPAARVACVEGLNFGRFEWITVGLYAVAGEETMGRCPIPQRFRCPSGGATGQ